MTDVVERLRKMGRRLVKQHGPVGLLALFKPEAAGTDEWEVVIAAPWLNSTDMRSWRLITQEVVKAVGMRGLGEVSGSVILGNETPLEFEGDGASFEPGMYRDFVFNGVPIRVGYVLESDAKLAAARKQRPARGARRKKARAGK